MRKLLGGAMLALVIAGCGGMAHPCHAMGCVLKTLPPAPVNIQQGADTTVYGLDFGWSGVSAATAKANGARFGLSYISYDPSKDWTAGALKSYHDAGLATVATFESTATRSEQGCAAGAADARYTEGRLIADGAPAHQPFTMAIDFDANGPEVEAYFHCAQAAEPGLVNAYGGYRPLLYLSQHHDVGSLNFQTYAWSGGQWLPASIAPLEQYLNGSAFDHDRAIAPNYGQWPFVAPVPKVNHHYGRYPTTRRKVCGCGERNVVRAYDRLRALQTPGHHSHRVRLKALRHDAGLLAGRIYTIAERCCLGDFNQGKPHWNVYHRRQRYNGLHRRAHGGIVK